MLIDKVLVLSTAIIKNKEGKVLLLKRSEKSSYPGHWQLVEGKSEENESPPATIRREIEEELGIETKTVECNDVFYNELEVKGLKYLCFKTVFDVSISSEAITISDEHSAFGWFGKDDFKDLLLLPGTEKVLQKVYT